jgi:transcription antitermination factor NusG
MPLDTTRICVPAEQQDASEGHSEPVRQPCSGKAEISKMHDGWGGPRANSGGARLGAGRPRKQVEPLPELIGWEGLRWCVFATHPQAEKTAAADLTRAGYRTYVPMTAILRADRALKTSTHVVNVPMLVGYAFWQCAFADPWLPVKRADGVRDVLRTASGHLSPTREGDVERLIADEPQRLDLAAAERMPTFAPGDAVSVLDGPLTSFAGVVVECDGIRTHVDVEMFGRVVPVWLNRASVEPK